MDFQMSHLYQRVFNTPLMMHEGKAYAALEGIGARIVGGDLVIVSNAERVDHIAGQRPIMGRLGDPLGARFDADRRAPYSMTGNVAVIPIEGTLVHKGAYVGKYSGATSYQGLQTQISRAARDPQVAGVAFEVDSFGGEVAGAFETADMIAELSKAKPTVAILTDFALSAGYLLASAARTIIVPKSGAAGSIGVITMHADMSGKLAKEGIAITVISAGARKADRSPTGPLPIEVFDRIKASVERTRLDFASAVGRYRGSRFNTAQALATEAEVFDGADAVAIGLADAVGHGSAAFEAFVREMSRRAR